VPASWEEHVKLMFDLLVLAYRADITRIGTFQLAQEASTHATRRSARSRTIRSRITATSGTAREKPPDHVPRLAVRLLPRTDE
jgi:hypothetical protein